MTSGADDSWAKDLDIAHTREMANGAYRNDSRIRDHDELPLLGDDIDEAI